jgi:DNA-binding GntR family transcriptional regulator
MEELRGQSLTVEDAGNFTSALRRTAIPDQVVVLLRRMILTGKWRPGDRIVETRIAKQLGIGQPTVREALGKLEEAGLVVRSPNCGCTVTQLTEKEYGDVFRVRMELESLAVELAAESEDVAKKKVLGGALKQLKEAAESGAVEEFYSRDLEFHQEIWSLADNRFLERALSQLVVPLFAFVTIKLLEHGHLDLPANVREHEKLVRAILDSDKARAKAIAEQVLEGFWKEGIGLLRDP